MRLITTNKQMITNEEFEQGWLRDPSLWEINVLKHVASTRLIEHLSPNCFLPLPLPLVLAISVPNKWINSSALLELQLQCWWNPELCYYNQSTGAMAQINKSVEMIPGNNSPTSLSTSTPPSGPAAVRARFLARHVRRSNHDSNGNWT